MTKHCPICKSELTRIVIDGKELYCHVPSNCLNSNDGIKLNLEIKDANVFNNFQKSVIEIKEEPKEDLILNIKRRVSLGTISIQDFNEIKKLLKEN